MLYMLLFPRLQPFKISSLVLHPLEPGSFLVLVLTPYRVLTSWFSLKALSESVAQEWMDTISTAQVHVPPSLTLPLSPSLTHPPSLTLSPPHTLTLSLSLSHPLPSSHPRSLPLPLSLSLSHPLPSSHPHTLPHTLPHSTATLRQWRRRLITGSSCRT